jgi:CRISPR/Cas system type I-B associated protein Csh2 (Cas7 group RAMP superfamily)
MSLTPEQLAAPVDVGAIAGMNAPTRSSDSRLNRRDMPSGRTQYRTSAAGAIDWMFGLSSEEVETLQKQLWNAGYFTTVEYNPQTDQMTMTDTSYEPGYANNPDTRLAWYKAVTDAVSTNRSIEQVLADKQTEFKQREQRVRDQVMQQRQASFEKELGSTRAAADKIAVDTLGRRLSTEEYVRMRQYLRDLQQPRMDDVAGRETADWMASAPDVGYTEEEFSQGVSDVLAEPRREYTNSNNWARINKSLGID